jgi:hypothetical protein
MYELVQEQEAMPGIADGFISKLCPCAEWKMTAKERHEGDFKAKTNFPILFVNGEYDPCTPLSSAFDISELFEGSVVLTHAGMGRKFFRHPSICTARAVRAYFIDGTMPDEGTVCQPDVPAFQVAFAGGQGAKRNTTEEALKA